MQPSRLTALQHPRVPPGHRGHHLLDPVRRVPSPHIRQAGARMELPGFSLLLFHLPHNHRPRRLHPRGRQRPTFKAALQSLHHG